MTNTTVAATIVVILLAAIVVPIVMAETARFRRRKPSVKAAPPVAKPAAPKTPLRLVVNKSDMDRELAALLAQDSRKSTERED